MMSDNNPDPVERLVQAYETMLERVNDLIETTEKKTMPVIREALADAKEKAVELGELTREEAEKVSGYLERDMHDAAHFISETGQEFRDWFKFDWQLVEGRLFDLFAGVADQTSLALREWADRANAASLYHTGEITGPGTLTCVNCGKEIHFKKTGHIPPCAKCKGTSFQRDSTATDEQT